MRNLVFTAALVLAFAGAAFATITPAAGSIEFVDSASPGGWQYDGVDTFSFAQPVTVSDVGGSGADTLNGMFVHLPNLIISNYSVIGTGMASATVTPQGAVEFWTTSDNSGTMLMQADFIDDAGSFFAYFAAGNLYAQDTPDLAVSVLNNAIGSDILGNMQIGTPMGFILTLNHDDNFTDFLFQTPAVSAANGFSGQINIIPEPATLALMGLGILLLRKQQ